MPASLLFDPDSFYYGVLPVLAETAEGFGVAGVNVGLAGVDLGEHQKKTIPLAFAVSIIMLVIAIITGGIRI